MHAEWDSSSLTFCMYNIAVSILVSYSMSPSSLATGTSFILPMSAVYIGIQKVALHRWYKGEQEACREGLGFSVLLLHSLSYSRLHYINGAWKTLHVFSKQGVMSSSLTATSTSTEFSSLCFLISSLHINLGLILCNIGSRGFFLVSLVEGPPEMTVCQIVNQGGSLP